MRPWYRYSEKTDDYQDYRQVQYITPFSRVWGYGARVTITLIIINVAIWLIMVITDGLGWLPLVDWWYEYFAMSPENVLHKWRIHQIITSVFLHDCFSILHLAFNMYLLWMFGTRVERTFSSRRFLAFFLICGIGGSLLSLLARSLMGDFETPSIGASAAVFGVLVAYGFLFSNDKLLLFFVIPVKAWKLILAFIILETLLIILQLLHVDLGPLSDVDHWAHLGGAGVAAIWMLVLTRRKGDKTHHGWFHSKRTTVPPKGKKGFRVIITKPKPTSEDHPEGTDNEPPPDWFKL